MATPKKRTGKAAQASRRANWKGQIPETTTCKNCNAVILTHTVCPECGYYKDGFASLKDKNKEPQIQNAEMKVEEVKPAKKTTRKAAPKKAKKAEEKAAETVEASKEQEEALQETKEEAVETAETPAEEENK